MLTPTIEEARKYAADGRYDICPVRREILSDFRTPIEVMRALMNVSGHCYMFESADATKRRGRYTFLGFDPKMGISIRNGKMKVGDLEFETRDPNSYIRQVLGKYRSPKVDGFPPFTGGLVGYFSYDYLKYAEPSLDLDAKDDEMFNDIDLMLFDRVVVFDNFAQKLLLIANVNLSRLDTDYNRAESDIRQMEEIVRHGAPKPDLSGRLKSEIRPFFTEEQYCSMIEKAKERIYEGDIFQVVLSNRLEADYEGSLFNTYRVLRTVNPSPYMFYFSGSDMEVAGASPETLVKLEDGILHTFPLAGTRPRGKTEEEDRELAEGLLKDPKELAEHNMLVDLGRNDIGKISEFGTVKVERFHCIERYSHVMHIGSSVRGEIARGKDALDAVGAVLPAGTLSGAPKIRACQIINSLENCKRGIYGGGFGYIGFGGNLDLCIGIRLAYKKNGKVFIRSGAGIVADSQPHREYKECLDKAAAVVFALKKAEDEDL